MEKSCVLNGNSNKINEKNIKNIVPLISKDLVSAAGFNVDTPIVSALIGNLQGTLPTRKIESEAIKCEICDCELSSNTMLDFHLNGIKHKKKLKALEIIKNLKQQKNSTLYLGDNENPNSFRCDLCLMTVNSAQQLEFHLSGIKHKKKAAAATPADRKDLCKKHTGALNSPEPFCKKKIKDESFLIPCRLCNVFVNSKIQFNQHLVSRKHLSKLKWDKDVGEIEHQKKIFIHLPYWKQQCKVNHYKISTSSVCQCNI